MFQLNSSLPTITHNPEDLISIFNRLFRLSEHTVLVRGGEEPIYIPANAECDSNQVVFAHGFYSSALHEIAHWCLAGKERRKSVDYGYWYAPDGRDAKQQADFEKVEVKPQAIEWILSKTCNKSFRVSVDNLNGETSDSSTFKQAVYSQVLVYIQCGMPSRAEVLRRALAEFYCNPGNLDSSKFALSELF